MDHGRCSVVVGDRRAAGEPPAHQAPARHPPAPADRRPAPERRLSRDHAGGRASATGAGHQLAARRHPDARPPGLARPRRADRARRRLPRRPDAGPAAALGRGARAHRRSASPPCPSRSPWCPATRTITVRRACPFPWLVLGIAVYPAAWFLARWYTRQAERIEQDFAEVVDALVNYTLSIVAVALVCLTTLVVGGLGLRLSRRTSDFYVAGRTVSPRLNASAISGEYLSAASFLGVAGLIYDRGVDMLWLPVGYTLGYLVLLVVVAAPMRRSGAYTLPDFAEARLGSRAIRLVSSAARRRHRLALPRAPVPGREPDPDPRHRRPRVGRWVRRHGRHRPRRRRRRHALDHLRAGRPVLDQAHRPGRARLRAARALVPVGLAGAAGRPVVEHPAVPRPAPTTTRPTARHPRCSPSASARWACRTCSCATTPTPTASAPAARPSPCIALLGVFYLLPPIYGALGRVAYPTLPPGVGSDTIVLRLPETLLPGPGRAAAHGDARRGRVRGVPVHGIRPGHVGDRRHRPGAAAARGSPGSRAATCPASGASGSRRSSRSSSPTPSAGPPSRSAWPPPSGWPSRSRRRRSRRCSCSASGGAGCRRGVRWPGWSSAARRRPLAIGWTIATGPRGRLAGRAARQPGDVGDAAGDRHRGLVSLATPSRIPAGTTRTMVRLHTPERVALARSRIRD